MPRWPARIPILAAPLAAAALGGCVPTTMSSPFAMRTSLEERDCMARAMYFESDRSSRDGMLAVGTVVMNRLESGKYPKTICGVVGEERQFAQGVLTKPAEGRSFALAQDVASSVIAGRRHDDVGAATHFHTAGYTFKYRNMAYTAKAGGNVFYEKKEPGTFTPVRPHTLVARDEKSGSNTREAAHAKPKPATQLAEASRREKPVASASED